MDAVAPGICMMAPNRRRRLRRLTRRPVELEKRINETLLTLPITRIHVAHRPQTIALADRVVRLGCSPEAASGLRLLAAE